jgi:hypothetical protein
MTGITSAAGRAVVELGCDHHGDLGDVADEPRVAQPAAHRHHRTRSLRIRLSGLVLRRGGRPLQSHRGNSRPWPEGRADPGRPLR